VVVEQPADRSGGVGDLVADRVMELLPHAGHREEDRRPAGAQVLGDVGEAAGEPGLAARDDLAHVAHDAFGDVAQRQERQEPIIGPDLDDRGDAVDREAQIRVREHRALRWSGHHYHVNDRGDRRRLDLLAPREDEARFVVEPVSAGLDNVVERDDEVVIEALAHPIEHEDPFERREGVAAQQHLGELIAVLHEAGLRLRVPEHVRDLTRHVRGVHRNRRRRRAHHREVGLVPPHRVRTEDPDPVTRLHTQLGEAGDERRDLFAVLRPRDRAPLAADHVPKRGARWPPVHMTPEELDDLAHDSVPQRCRRLLAVLSSPVISTVSSTRTSRPARSSPPKENPRTHVRSSAQRSSGGSTISVDSSAIATWTATTIPNSRSNGMAEKARTPKPPMRVSPDATNARPMRVSPLRTATAGVAPASRSSAYRASMSTANSVATAITSGPATVVSGVREMPIQ